VLEAILPDLEARAESFRNRPQLVEPRRDATLGQILRVARQQVAAVVAVEAVDAGACDLFLRRNPLLRVAKETERVEAVGQAAVSRATVACA
jgi:hypothetical protein